MYRYASLFFLFSLFEPSVLGFAPSANRKIAVNTELYSSSSNINRRDIIGSGFSALSLLIATAAIPSPSYADIAAGDTLPDGVAQFSRIVRAKSNLVKVEKRVRENAKEMDEKEWENVSVFLRKVYNVGDDMKVLAKRMKEPEKMSKATDYAKLLQEAAKAADVPASKQDGEGFLIIARAMEITISDFLVVLRDVPDDL